MEKDDLKKMEAKLLLFLPEGLEVTNIDMIDGVLTISAVSTQKSACCPLCSSLGTHVHGHYTRTIADLPYVGQPARLRVQVRKFFCDVTGCARKIFTERIAPQPYQSAWIAPLRLAGTQEASRATAPSPNDRTTLLTTGLTLFTVLSQPCF